MPTLRSDPQARAKRLFLEAMEDQPAGHLNAAKAADVRLRVLLDWIRTDPKFAGQLRATYGRIDDLRTRLAVDGLFGLIASGKGGAAEFALLLQAQPQLRVREAHELVSERLALSESERALLDLGRALLRLERAQGNSLMGSDEIMKVEGAVREAEARYRWHLAWERT